MKDERASRGDLLWLLQIQTMIRVQNPRRDYFVNICTMKTLVMNPKRALKKRHFYKTFVKSNFQCYELNLSSLVINDKEAENA